MTLLAAVSHAFDRPPSMPAPSQLFVKSSWHVSDAFTSKYARWRLGHLAGDPGTGGQFDEARYQYAIRCGHRVHEDSGAAQSA